MKRIENIAQAIAESLFNERPCPQDNDEKYNIALDSFNSTLEEMQSLSMDNEEIMKKIFAVEETFHVAELRVMHIAFAQGIIYGLGLKNQIEDINLNEF